MGVSFKLSSIIPRRYLTYNSASKVLSSKDIREEFIKYFVDRQDHIFIKSSPVVPFCDPTVPFVNAGMNQFKGVFLSQCKPPFNRAVNSQKCIRVDGKHNDLENVGNDGYHHTFFEMLGNWSFGDYFKERACRMAWDLLVYGPYNLSPERLYVTYFGGDKGMNIEPDWETRDIWLSIGVAPDRILPFGPLDNFWEMGPIGPCGPCSEIHYDHEDGRKNASHRVNQGFEDLVEIWNLVFIQYNRELDGSLRKLPVVHVDTGMGLERLVAIMQGKQSNYDTDLFLPLFNAIQKSTHCPEYKGSTGKLDTHYRVLADHARMVTVAIADGMFPDQNVKLRQVLRRAFCIAENSFRNKKGLVAQITNHVADSLAEAYPEIGAKLKEVQLIINHEEDVYKSIKKSIEEEWTSLIGSDDGSEKLNVEMMPGIVGAFKELQKVKSIQKSGQIPGELSFKLFDTYGLDVNTIQSLSEHFGFLFDVKSYHQMLLDIKKQSRFSHHSETSSDVLFHSVVSYANEHNIAVTDDTLKYSYTKEKDEYVFPPISCRIEALVCDDQCVSKVASGKLCSIIVDKTNLYHEAGGQISDSGYFILKDGNKVLVNSIQNIRGYLLHEVQVPNDCKIMVGDQVSLHVAVEKRLGSMRNHTATHILNGALHNTLTVMYQKSSHVTDSYLTFEFAVYGKNFNFKHVHEVEELVRHVINEKISVKRTTINSQQLQDLYVSDQVTLVPGEVYPNEGIHIIEIFAPNLTSREACCGTHLLNTGDISDFCITAIKSPSSGTRTVSAVTGVAASNAMRQGIDISNQVNKLVNVAHSLVNEKSATLEKAEDMVVELNEMKQNIIKCGKHSLPYSVRMECIEKIDEVCKILKQFQNTLCRRALQVEMKFVIQDLYSKPVNDPFLVHSLACSTSMEDISLDKATKMCPYIPVLIIANCSNFIKARCCVPKTLVSKDFNAKIWMEQVLPVFGAEGFVPRGQNEKLVFNMKKKHVKENAAVLINDALSSASKFAKDSLSGQ